MDIKPKTMPLSTFMDKIHRIDRSRDNAVSVMSIANFPDSADIGIGMGQLETNGMRLTKGAAGLLGAKKKCITEERWEELGKITISHSYPKAALTYSSIGKPILILDVTHCKPEDILDRTIKKLNRNARIKGAVSLGLDAFNEHKVFRINEEALPNWVITEMQFVTLILHPYKSAWSIKVPTYNPIRGVLLQRKTIELRTRLNKDHPYKEITAFANSIDWAHFHPPIIDRVKRDSIEALLFYLIHSTNPNTIILTETLEQAKKLRSSGTLKLAAVKDHQISSFASFLSKPKPRFRPSTIIAWNPTESQTLGYIGLSIAKTKANMVSTLELQTRETNPIQPNTKNRDIEVDWIPIPTISQRSQFPVRPPYRPINPGRKPAFQPTGRSVISEILDLVNAFKPHYKSCPDLSLIHLPENQHTLRTTESSTDLTTSQISSNTSTTSFSFPSTDHTLPSGISFTRTTETNLPTTPATTEFSFTNPFRVTAETTVKEFVTTPTRSEASPLPSRNNPGAASNTTTPQIHGSPTSRWWDAKDGTIWHTAETSPRNPTSSTPEQPSPRSWWWDPKGTSRDSDPFSTPQRNDFPMTSTPKDSFDPFAPLHPPISLSSSWERSTNGAAYYVGRRATATAEVHPDPGTPQLHQANQTEISWTTELAHSLPSGSDWATCWTTPPNDESTNG